MSESLTDYLKEHGVKVRYMHSDIDTLERIDIVNGLRGGEFDVLCGINLLRKGSTFPRSDWSPFSMRTRKVSCAAKLRSFRRSGAQPRNADGKVIMYADNITGSMRRAIDETNRRREVQSAYNREHNITPRTIQKEIKSSLAITQKQKQIDEHISADQIPAEIEKLKALMKVASNQLDFEKAIEIRDTINLLKRKLRR